MAWIIDWTFTYMHWEFVSIFKKGIVYCRIQKGSIMVACTEINNVSHWVGSCWCVCVCAVFAPCPSLYLLSAANCRLCVIASCVLCAQPQKCVNLYFVVPVRYIVCLDAAHRRTGRLRQRLYAFMSDAGYKWQRGNPPSTSALHFNVSSHILDARTLLVLWRACQCKAHNVSHNPHHQHYLAYLVLPPSPKQQYTQSSNVPAHGLPFIEFVFSQFISCYLDYYFQMHISCRSDVRFVRAFHYSTATATQQHSFVVFYQIKCSVLLLFLFPFVCNACSPHCMHARCEACVQDMRLNTSLLWRPSSSDQNQSNCTPRDITLTRKVF